MSKAALAARLLLGLVFVVMGLNGLISFLPMPEPEPAAMEFMGAMMATGFLWPLLKVVEIIGGAMLMSGKYVPLGIVLLAPAVIPIFGFNILVAPSAIVMGLLVMALWLILVAAYWGHFRCLLNMNAKASETASGP